VKAGDSLPIRKTRGGYHRPRRRGRELWAIHGRATQVAAEHFLPGATRCASPRGTAVWRHFNDVSVTGRNAIRSFSLSLGRARRTSFRSLGSRTNCRMRIAGNHRRCSLQPNQDFAGLEKRTLLVRKDFDAPGRFPLASDLYICILLFQSLVTTLNRCEFHKIYPLY
jgi:hypothetical protein